MEETGNQSNNSKPWLFKKGQSGNPSGRPKGILSMKEYARNMLASMNEEERMEFMHGLPKDVIWKMAEGNFKQDTDITSKGERIIIMPAELINKNDTSQNSGNSCEGQPQI
jgi:hypothetical protein